MSDILEKTKPKTTRTEDGDHDKFSHYFSKKAINDNLMSGKPMVALCGKIVARQSDQHGRTVCQACKDELGKLQP